MRKKNIENLKTEKEGLIVLNQLVENLIIPTKEQIIFLYELLNIDYKKYYKSIDAMISYMNENHNSSYILKYSTPSIYVEALK